MSNERIAVLFVCTGNICRSPTAQGVFEALVREAELQERFLIDSAGTSRHHVGQAPDPRTQKAARDRGLDLSRQRARQVRSEDLQRFHYLVAMDTGHYEDLLELRDKQGEGETTSVRIVRLLDFVADPALQDVPDPYYGPINGFGRVYDIVANGCQAFLQHLRREHGF